MEYLKIILILTSLALIIRAFTVLTHELGHAIPAIIFTREKVTIYLGSYGDPKKSAKITIGLLEVWFRYNPILWQRGLCVPYSKNISIPQQIFYTLAGPFTSFLIGLIACYFAFGFDSHGAIKLISILFLSSSIIDLFVNLSKNETPILLHSGELTYNDRYLLCHLFSFYKYPKTHKEIFVFIKNKKYADAVVTCDRILNDNPQDDSIYRLAIYSNLMVKNYNRAKELVDILITFNQINSDDFVNAGLTYSYLANYDLAYCFYEKSLELNPKNKYALNNKGYTMNLQNRFDEAIPVFDQAIEIDRRFAFSFNNRGLSKIKTGKVQEGLKDINYSLTLDKNNSYGYRNLGIYHLDLKEFPEALKLLYKAKELDNSTHLIDELIEKAQWGLMKKV